MEKKRVLRWTEIIMCMQQDVRTQDVVPYVMGKDAAVPARKVLWDPLGQWDQSDPEGLRAQREQTECEEPRGLQERMDCGEQQALQEPMDREVQPGLPGPQV